MYSTCVNEHGISEGSLYLYIEAKGTAAARDLTVTFFRLRFEFRLSHASDALL